jgi:hypothetical protein
LTFTFFIAKKYGGEDMSIYRNLQPHVHVLKLTGGTGDGKTEIATVFASKEARKVLLRGVGR